MIKLYTLILMLVLFFSYSFFLYSVPAVKISTSNDRSADQGKLLWQQNNCSACHQVYGLGGFLGPDLTNVYSKRGPAYIQAFIRSGTRVMPAFRFNDNEIKHLTAYFKKIDASGNADPRSFTLNYDGTIEQ